MYPGISVALQVTQLTLATLLHNFEIASPSNEPVDMTKKVKLTNQKPPHLKSISLPAFMLKYMHNLTWYHLINQYLLWCNNMLFNFQVSIQEPAIGKLKVTWKVVFDNLSNYQLIICICTMSCVFFTIFENKLCIHYVL